LARDRKRAKQRRERRGTAAAVHGTSYRENGAADGAQGEVVRADLPGALDHAGAEVDEFDAALVRGGAGTPVTRDDQAEFDAEVEDALQEPVGPGGIGAGGAGGGGLGGEGARPSGAPLRPGNKAIGFLRASWAELQRVQWPDRRQVTQATAVVLGFVTLAGVYLGVADTVAKEIVEFIL
jgi:preprotein translocase subunit SecE